MGAAQASCGLAGLPALEGACSRRARSAERLAASLADVPGIHPQRPTEGATSAWTQFVVRAKARDRLQRTLLAAGIDTTMGYLQACHRLPGTGLEGASFPHSDALDHENLYLPVSDELDDATVDWMAATVRRALSAHEDAA
jgi:dTDP-4-amino-4,6-dideoxygalactose transaminase